MGSDGGLRITKISNIRKNWKDIRDKLSNSLGYYFNEPYLIKYKYDLTEKIKQLPENIDNLSNEEICKILQIFQNCDCPYLYEDNIITGEGDYVSEEMNMLSYALPGIYIETWT